MAPETITESSSTLWATASKEWAILPRPKPGRKPKKDSVSQSEGDSECRKTQNRVAQRAFRERKQSQLAELQARIRSYEQEEIERNVALQKVAKRLKEENQLLREKNDILKARVAELEARVQTDAQIVPSCSNNSLATDRKRNREFSPPLIPHSPIPHATKSTRGQDYQRHEFSIDTVVSSSSLEFTTAVDRASLLPYTRQEMRGTDLSAQGDSLTNLEHNEPLPAFLSCDYCEAGTLCICHETAFPTSMGPATSARFGTRAEENRIITSVSPNLQAKSLSERRNKPPIYEPTVPIRRRNEGLPTNTIFPVYEAPLADNIPEVTCSGDPNDCLACEGDSFGQAFCTAIGTSSQKCDCCTGCSSSPLDCSSSVPSLDRSIPLTEVEMMPTNNAWQKLKSHPNVQFADLTLLAEVVVRKARCNGPELVVSSTSHSDTSEANGRANTDTNQGDHFRPAPHEILLECGRKRLRQVPADGVQEALRFLDIKFS